MAKVLVIILKTDGLDPNTPLCDANGIKYGIIPDIGTFVTVDESSVDIGEDGTAKLYRPANGVFDNDAIEKAKNESGQTFSDPTISAVTSTGFKVTWVAANNNVDNYEVSITDDGTDISGSPFTMAGSTLSKTVSGLSSETEYVVNVTAINENGSVTTGDVSQTTSV